MLPSLRGCAATNHLDETKNILRFVVYPTDAKSTG
jgi:hypothetical protein